jgi:hypothetical protein
LEVPSLNLCPGTSYFNEEFSWLFSILHRKNRNFVYVCFAKVHLYHSVSPRQRTVEQIGKTKHSSWRGNSWKTVNFSVICMGSSPSQLIPHYLLCKKWTGIMTIMMSLLDMEENQKCLLLFPVDVGKTKLLSVIIRMPNYFLLLSRYEGNPNYLLPLLGYWGKSKPSCAVASIYGKP